MENEFHYIRHLTESGDWEFSNVKSIGQLSDLTTKNKDDIVSAINEINRYFQLDVEGVKNLLESIESMNETISNLDIVVRQEKEMLEQLALDVEKKKDDLDTEISNARTELNEKIEKSESDIENLNEKAEKLQQDIVDNGISVDGKIVAIKQDIVDTNLEVSRKLSKSEYDENAGANKWIATFYESDKKFDQEHPKVLHIVDSEPVYVKEIDDSVSLFQLAGDKTGILHLYTNVYVRSAKNVSFNIGHETSASTLINGGYVYYKTGKGSGTVSISLIEGWNNIEFLVAVVNNANLTTSAKISEMVDKMTTIIGVGNKNDTRLKNAETMIKQTNEELSFKADSLLVESLGNIITENTAQIKINSEAISSRVEKEEFNKYTGRLENAETQINQTSESIKTLASKTDYDRLNGTVESQQSTIEQMAGKIDLKASQSDLDVATGNINTLNSQLSVHADQIKTKVSQTEVDNSIKSINEKIKNSETAIEQTSKAIELKADKTTVDNLIDEVSIANASLSVQANQIESKVGQTEVDNSIRNIQVGGRNYAEDGDLTRGMWFGTTEVDGVIVNDKANKVIRVSNTSRAKWTQTQLQSNAYGVKALKLIESGEHTLSFEARVIDKDVANIGGFFRANKTNGVMNYIDMDNTSVGKDWTKFSKSGKIPSDYMDYFVYWRIVLAVNTEATVEFRNIKLEKGNKATDWTPAPEDMESKVASVESSITQTAEQIKTKVSKIDVDNAINNISIGGRNLLRGTEVTPELNSNNHAIYPIKSSKIMLDESEPYRRIERDSSPISLYLNLSRMLTRELAIDKTYTMSFYARTNSETDVALTTYFLSHNSSSPNTINNRWKKVSFSFKPLVSVTGTLNFILAIDSNVLDVKKMQLEEGNKATDWTPAPEDIESRIESVETSITQTSDEISLKASKAEVNNAIDNIKVGGVNLIPNSKNFKSDWVSYVNWYYGSEKYKGFTVATNSQMWGGVGYLIYLEEGTYTFSYYVKALIETDAIAVYLSANQNPATTYPNNNIINVTTDWTRQSFTFNVLQAGYVVPRIENRTGYDTKNNTTFICGFKLEKGNKATDWTPANEDVDEKLTSIQSELTVQANSIKSKVTSSQVVNEITNHIKIRDTRHVNEPPSYYYTNYPLRTVEEFKYVSVMKVKEQFEDSSPYGLLTTSVRWTDSSGGTVKQRFVTDVASYEREGTYTNGTGVDVWRNWKRMVDYVSMGTYVNQTIDSWGVDVVRDGSILSSINASTEGVKIKGDKVDITGAVTFNSLTGEVKDAIDNAVEAYQMSSSVASDIDKVRIMGMATSSKLVYEDVKFSKGLNNVYVYNNSFNGNVTVTRIERPSDCPTTSTHALEIKTVGTASPYRGGFYQMLNGRPNAKFLVKYLAKVPANYYLRLASNSMGNGYTDVWLTSNEGTGNYKEYVRLVTCGKDGSFGNSGHVAIDGGVHPTVDNPCVWHVASIEAYDLTDFEPIPVSLKNTIDTASKWQMTGKTTINGGMIEADTIKSAQIIAGAITADKITTGAITTEKIYAGAITSVKIATGAITADKITTGAITADKIEAGAITSTKLTADAIDGKTITGATIQTSKTVTTNGGLIIDKTGLKGYNTSGALKTELKTNGTLVATDVQINGTITAEAGSKFKGDIETTKNAYIGENLYLAKGGKGGKQIIFNDSARITGGGGIVDADMTISSDGLYFLCTNVDFSQVDLVDFTGTTVKGVTATFA